MPLNLTEIQFCSKLTEEESIGLYNWELLVGISVRAGTRGSNQSWVFFFFICQPSFPLCICLTLQIDFPCIGEYGRDHPFSLATPVIKCHYLKLSCKSLGENSNPSALSTGPSMKPSLRQRVWSFLTGRASASPYGSRAFVQMSK